MLRRSFERFSARVRFHWLADRPAADMVKAVAALPERSAIYYSTVRVDARGAPQEGDAVLFRFIDAGRAPVFANVDSHFGPWHRRRPHAAQSRHRPNLRGAGHAILGGAAAATSRSSPGLGTPVYDWRQLRRWHISEALLPPGSSIRFYEPGLWDIFNSRSWAPSPASCCKAR